MNYPVLLEQVAAYVRDYLQGHSSPALLYHNLLHTESVVAAAVQIAGHYPLNERDHFIVMTSAWFHDVGYPEDPHNHESAGAERAGVFLAKAGLDGDTIAAVKQCIMATKMPQSAQTLPEQIVCDADLFNLGTGEFIERGKRLRKEYETLHNISISKEDWRKKTVRLLENHRYYTGYCQNILEKKKQENLENLRRKIAETATSTESETTGVITPSAEQEGNKEKKKKYDGPERTIETMFRITSTNSQRLSDQADTKANILITVNSITLSVLLTLFFQKAIDYSSMSIPLGLLLMVNLSTIVFAILATRPKVPDGIFSRKDLDAHTVNLLFFGNFYRMKFQEYSAGMFQIMEDKKYLHTTLLRDIYHQGVVLGRKYRMLKIAYNVFMYGLILSVLAFFIVAAINKSQM
ncbi:MAG: DUF5706 domain-containing protein [Thermoanaerobaculia bacterium]|nr:DUF5706 domain-containing protein [Thermoanaerobaculia bacterium]